MLHSRNASPEPSCPKLALPECAEQAAPPAVPDTSDSSQAGSDDGNESDASDVSCLSPLSRLRCSRKNSYGWPTAAFPVDTVEQVQVEFEHYDPTEADYHLIKLLLRRYAHV